MKNVTNLFAAHVNMQLIMEAGGLQSASESVESIEGYLYALGDLGLVNEEVNRIHEESLKAFYGAPEEGRKARIDIATIAQEGKTELA